MRLPTTIVCALLGGLPTTSFSHELQNLSDQTQQLSDLLNTTRLKEIAETQADENTRYVYARLLLWQVGQKLKGCFFNGSDKEKSLVKKMADQIVSASGANISFDFGPDGSFRLCDEPGRRSDIRVSFNHGCCSAYIGRVAHYPQASLLSGPTVMLQGVSNLGDAVGRQIVVHELMHALGFEHEHQAPDNPCQFNKAAVQARTGMNDQEFSVNIGKLNKDKSSYKWSSYDNASIMKYFYYPEELVGGTANPCYSGNNLFLSDRDKEGLRNAYPSTGSKISRDVERSVVVQIGDGSTSSEVKTLVRALRELDTSR